MAEIDRQIIETRYRQLYDGMVRKDITLLNEVLDSAFVLRHMTGLRQSKAAFLRAIEDGTLNYFSADHRDIQAELHGDTAVLDGKSVVSAAVFGGGRSTWRLQLRLTLIRGEDTWRITEAKASTF